ncbi:hypothetical protein H4R19_004045 [Coemansia spiralis]|nr:hypothetical protein H4R19_004045 [Coemansia spiralis]
MFIRPRASAPEPYIRRTLLDLEYRIDPDDGMVRSIATGDLYSAGVDGKRAKEIYQSLVHPASREVYRVMTDGDLHMEPIAVPDSMQPHTNIYATRGALAKDKLVVIIVGHGTCGGVWAWSTLLKSGIHAGSVVDYVRAFSERGLGVLVLNPNENIIAPDGHSETVNSYDGPGVAIWGSETADEHVGYVWSQLLRDGAARSIAFVAYNSAGISVAELLKHDFARFVAKTAGVAFIDSLHSTYSLGAGAQAWLELGAKHWMSSNEPMDQVLTNDHVGCPTVSVENTTDSREMTPTICRASVVDHIAACLDRGPIEGAATLGDGQGYPATHIEDLEGALGSDDEAITEALESVHVMPPQADAWDFGAADRAAGDGGGEGEDRQYIGWD